MRDAEHDDEIRAMAREEVDRLEAAKAAELDALTVHLLPRDPNDDRNVILEIRAGAGAATGSAATSSAPAGEAGPHASGGVAP